MSMCWASVVNAISGACLASFAIRSSFVQTVVEPDVSSIFPSSGSVSRHPLPSTGSLGSVPPLRRYYGNARTPGHPSRLASFPSLGATTVRPLLSPLPPAWGATLAGPGFVTGFPFPIGRWKWLGLPGSWGTFARMPCSPTPTGPARQATTACRCCLPQFWNTSAPATLYFGAQSHGLRTRCLRFAARVSPGPRKTRFRLGAGLGRTGLATRKVPGEVSALLHGFLLTQASPGAPKTRSPRLDERRAACEPWSAMSIVLALLGALRAALRTRADLALENLALRQQLALLCRGSKRPQFSRLDR